MTTILVKQRKGPEEQEGQDKLTGESDRHDQRVEEENEKTKQVKWRKGPARTRVEQRAEKEH
jgi:hypothetical protein